ncbi:helix-turn-helix transcriptional regulator [Bosea sp. (in: a-proteobacteria)]|uniref:helix-turn-helix domain-containing protein n=1 Tax=Bosea sp. (in: a-proteobacteria) TaxID=1871050 RepID=UPI00262B4412|nr:helix-turn-helix transcriptional regulator [Bosea sp. (in: a-proteobacteria)]MCO5092032.1 helix-turn-helix transcriptional regulator [Bosea sp. (in: a-proteobacteria)]
MKLATYLTAQKLTHAEFAKAIGASTFAVGKWARGDRVPRPEAVAKIKAATQGQVTANDFFEQADAA